MIGAIQGYWIAYMRIPSFIVTLAGMLVFRGLSLAVLQGQSVGPFSPTFQKLSSGFIPDIIPGDSIRSEEHTSELQSLMRISYAVFCLKKKKQTNNHI